MPACIYTNNTTTCSVKCQTNKRESVISTVYAQLFVRIPKIGRSRDFLSPAPGSRLPAPGTVYLVECLQSFVVFLLPLPTLLLHGIFGGKCTTVFGAINMLSAFARVGASLCLLPLLRSLQCGAGVDAKRKGERRYSEEGREESIKRDESGS